MAAGRSTAKSIDLFVGAGGLALGTARAGFQHVAVMDWDRNACSTLRRNKADGVDHVRDWDIIEGDVRNHDFKQYENRVHLVSGGPPCQPFSIGGKHLGHTDDRNLFPEAIRAIRDIQPKGFVFQAQYRFQECRCQPTTVAGCTISRADRQRSQERDSSIQIRRSTVVSRGRALLLW